MPSHARRHPSKSQILVALIVSVLVLPETGGLLGQRSPRRTRNDQPEYFQWLKSREDLQDLSRLDLKNGLKILVGEDHTASLAILGLHLRAGRGAPTAQDFWAAPAALRMLFSGTERRTGEQISNQLWALGAQLQIESYTDESVIWATFPAINGRRVIELFADLLAAPSFPEQALDGVRRELLLEEGYRWAQSAAGFLHEPSASGSAPGGFLWEDAERGIKALSVAQVREYARRALRPDRATVVLYGDFLPESWIALAVRRFRELEPESNEDPSASGEQGSVQPKDPDSAVSPVEDPRYRQIRSEISRAVMRVAYPIPARADRDFWPLKLAAYLLAEGHSSYLNRRLVEEAHVGTRVSHFMPTRRLGPGRLWIQIDGETRNLDSIEIEFFSAMDRWRRRPPSAAELSRARALAVSDFFAALDTVRNRAENLLANELDGGYQTWIEEVDKMLLVTPQEVVRVADKYLRLEHARVTELLPRDAEERAYTDDTFSSTMQQILGAVGEVEGHPSNEGNVTDETRTDLNELVRGAAPAEIPTTPYRTSILRGPELQIWETHSLPIVDLGVFFPGGLVHEDGDHSGFTHLMLATLMRTSANDTYASRFEKLESWGGRIQPMVSKDFFGYRLRVLAPYAEKALDIVRDMVQNRDFVDEDVRQEIRLLAGAGRRQQDDPFTRLNLVMDRELYGDHPYGRNPWTLSPAAGAAKAQEVLTWYERHLDLVLPTVIVLGDTPGTALATYFAKHYSGSKYKVLRPETAATAPPSEPRSVAFSASIPGQRVAAISMLGPEGENEETLLIQVALLAAGRLLRSNSILMPEGLGMEALTGLRVARRGGRITFVVARAISEGDAGKHISRFVDGLAASLGRDTLARTKEAFFTDLRIQSQDRETLIARFAEAHFSKGRFYDVAALVQAVNAMTPAEFTDAMERYFSQQGRIETSPP